MSRTYDFEARWRGQLSEVERKLLKDWSLKAKKFGSCELKIGKERSRLALKFDSKALEAESKAQISSIGQMLLSQEGPEAAEALAEAIGTTSSVSGTMRSSYGKILARDWASKAASTLQLVIPERCLLKISLHADLAAPEAALR